VVSWYAGKAVGNVETALEEHRQQRNKMLREGR